MTHEALDTMRPAAAIGALAHRCLLLELETELKPGLVGPHDSGSHDDMDAAMLQRSADVLAPFFEALADAGARLAALDELRRIGQAAERAMLAATGGVNTHRGAIFGLGLLCAAAGVRASAGHRGASLGAIVRERWGLEIAAAAPDPESHGTQARRRFAAGGARAEAAAGFSTLYRCGLPALRRGRRLADEEAARVEAIFALVAATVDTNLLHRGGGDGLTFARTEAGAFLEAGGVGSRDWRARAAEVHRAFVARRLSPGGAADLLAMTLFVDAMDGGNALGVAR